MSVNNVIRLINVFIENLIQLLKKKVIIWKDVYFEYGISRLLV